MRFLLLVLAATLVVAASAACGGDDEPAGTTVSIDPSRQRPEPPADQSRWAQEVDSACSDWQDRLDSLPPPENAETLEEWVAETLPLLRSQIDAVAGVSPPVKEEEVRKAELFLEGLSGVEQALTRYLNAIRRGNPEAMEKALTDANEAGSRTRAYAISLDITQCGGYSSG